MRQSTSITGCVWRTVGLSVGRVTYSFDDPHVAPYWPTWPCSYQFWEPRKMVSIFFFFFKTIKMLFFVCCLFFFYYWSIQYSCIVVGLPFGVSIPPSIIHRLLVTKKSWQRFRKSQEKHEQCLQGEWFINLLKWLYSHYFISNFWNNQQFKQLPNTIENPRWTQNECFCHFWYCSY